MRLISSGNTIDVPYEGSSVFVDTLSEKTTINIELFGNDEPYTLGMYKRKSDALLEVTRMREAYIRGDKYYQFKNVTT